MHIVLSTPELRALILEEVALLPQAHAQLLNCALVAKKWKWALELLWNMFPKTNLHRLAAIARQDLDRPRQDIPPVGGASPRPRWLEYASILRTITLEEDSTPEDDLPVLQMAHFLSGEPHPFSSLRSLTLDLFVDPTSVSWLYFISLALLSKNLLEFRCTVGPTPIFLIQQLSNTSPSLTLLAVGDEAYDPGVRSQFESALGKFQYLKMLDLDLSWIDWEVISTLSRLPRLRRLDFQSHTSNYASCPLLSQQAPGPLAPHPFAALKRLTVVAPPRLIQLIVSRVVPGTSLDRLELTICPPTGADLDTNLPLVGPSTLSVLKIKMEGTLRLREEMLHPFKTCVELQELHLFEGYSSRISNKSLLDLLCYWPSLEILKLNPTPNRYIRGEQTGVTLDILPEILQACRRLKSLSTCFSLPPEPLDVGEARLKHSRGLHLNLGASFFSETDDEWIVKVASYVMAILPHKSSVSMEQTVPKWEQPAERDNEYKRRCSKRVKDVHKWGNAASIIKSYSKMTRPRRGPIVLTLPHDLTSLLHRFRDRDTSLIIDVSRSEQTG